MTYNVDSKLKLNELPNGVENISTPQNRFDDGGEVVVEENYAGRSDGHFRP
jgi:hypothetical protein